MGADQGKSAPQLACGSNVTGRRRVRVFVAFTEFKAAGAARAALRVCQHRGTSMEQHYGRLQALSTQGIWAQLGCEKSAYVAFLHVLAAQRIILGLKETTTSFLVGFGGCPQGLLFDF